MPKTSPAGTPLTVALDGSSSVPLYRQLYEGVRQAILQGRLAAGARLPATRTLAADLGVSRNTVLVAFDQLLAEGYVEGAVGCGTFVSRALPEQLPQVPARPRQAKTSPGGRPRLSRRGSEFAATPLSVSWLRDEARAFQPGLPALDAFPFKAWARLVARHWRRPPVGLLGYGEPAGYRPLREAIAAYLGPARGVRCTADQVLITGGPQRAVNLVAWVLLDEGDAAWVEDPGYLGARAALLGAGVRPVPVPVDGEGLDVAAGAARAPEARLAFVSPSHQDPLGVTMSLPRRLALVDWAGRSGARVLEDDWGSEFRYSGRPLAALQGLDPHGRVLYAGMFGQILFPALRLGYLVVPLDLIDPFLAARAVADRQAMSLDQAILADFITQGQFARHLRRMRTLYAERQAVLVRAARRELGGLLEVHPAEAGMHLVGWLGPGVDDVTASRQAADQGVIAPALSAYGIEPVRRGGLLLGYAATGAKEIREGVGRLAAALRHLPKTRRSPV